MRSSFSKRFRSGFTIIELLLYMGLLAIFLSVISEIFVASLDVQIELEAISAVEQDGRYITSRVRYDLGRASYVSLPLNLGDIGQTLQATISGKVVGYSLSGSNLIITEGGNANQLNSSESLVSNLQFKKTGNVSGKPLVTASFTLTSRTKRAKGADSKVFQTTIGLR